MHNKVTLEIEVGTLYIVSTPIGNLKDITHRAIEMLNNVDLIAAEDTRRTGVLLKHYDIKTPLSSFNSYNQVKKSGHFIARLLKGQDLALVSDAGTPLISDPGYRLVRTAKNIGLKVSTIPGPCALIAAISASGLPSDRFIFEGFLPAKSSARIAKIQSISSELRTIIFYEAPHRILETLEDMLAVINPLRQIFLARELTKTHETFLSGTLIEVLELVRADINQQKGEIVLVLAGSDPSEENPDTSESDRMLSILLEELPLKQAASLVAKITGGQKNIFYKLALSLKK